MIKWDDVCEVLSAQSLWHVDCLLNGRCFCYHYHLAGLWIGGNSKVEKPFEEKKGTEPRLNLSLLATEWLRYPISTPEWLTAIKFSVMKLLVSARGWGKKIEWTCVCYFIASSETHICWAQRRSRWCGWERKVQNSNGQGLVWILVFPLPRSHGVLTTGFVKHKCSVALTKPGLTVTAAEGHASRTGQTRTMPPTKGESSGTVQCWRAYLPHCLLASQPGPRVTDFHHLLGVLVGSGYYKKMS